MKNLFLILFLVFNLTLIAQPNSPTDINSSYLLDFLPHINKQAEDISPSGNWYFQDANCNVANFTAGPYTRNQDSLVVFRPDITYTDEMVTWLTADSLPIDTAITLFFQNYNDDMSLDTICSGYIGPTNGMRYHGLQIKYQGATYLKYFLGLWSSKQ